MMYSTNFLTHLTVFNFIKSRKFGSWVEGEIAFLRIFVIAFHAYFRLG